jgi:hypothetical protein
MSISDALGFIITVPSEQGKHHADEDQHANPLVAQERPQAIFAMPQPRYLELPENDDACHGQADVIGQAESVVVSEQGKTEQES